MRGSDNDARMTRDLELSTLIPNYYGLPALERRGGVGAGTLAVPAFFAVSTYPKRAAQVVVVRVAARGGAFDAMEAATGQTGGSNLLSLQGGVCLLYTSPSPRDKRQSRMPSSA